jgi:hypothetical protein
MANRYWLGVNGNLTDTANWAATRGGAGGETVPGANDDVYIETGIVPSTNLAGITGDLGSFTWSLPGSLGTSSTPISIQVSGTSGITGRSGVVRITTTTFVNLQAAGASGIDKLSLELPSNGVAILSVTSTGGFAANSGDYIHIDGGTVTLSGEAAAAASTKVRVVSGILTGEADATYTFQAVDVGPGATFKTARSCVSLDVSSGASAQTTDGAGVSTLLVVHPNGSFNHAGYGTIALSDVRPGGKADAKGSKYNFTLTAKVKWKGSSNFEDATKLLNVPSYTTVGETTT